MDILHNQYRRLVCLPGTALVVLALLAIASSPALAQSSDSAGNASDKWKITLAPYLMIPWMDGQVAARGLDKEIAVTPSDIFENLQIGGMGYFEARKGSWGTGVDAVFMALGTNADRLPASADVNQGAYTFIGLRKLNDKVDLVFGARWNVIQSKLTFKGQLLQGEFKDTKQWVDPIVGLKIKQPLKGRFHLGFEGDIGGFNAASEFAWELFPTIGLDVSKRGALAMGYRVLSMNYSTGSGNELFKYNVATQAIVLGMTINF